MIPAPEPKGARKTIHDVARIADVSRASAMR